MKRKTFIFSLCILALVTGLFSCCPDLEKESSVAGSHFVVTAVIDDESTKVSAEEDGNNLQPSWELGDKIIAFDKHGKTYGFRVYKIAQKEAYMELVTQGEGCGNTIVEPEGKDTLFALFAKDYSMAGDSITVSVASQSSESLPWVMTSRAVVSSFGGAYFKFTNHIAVIGFRAPGFAGMEDGKLDGISVCGDGIYSEAVIRIKDDTLSVTPLTKGEVYVKLSDPISVTGQKTPDETRIFIGMFTAGVSTDLNILADFTDNTCLYRMQKDSREILKNRYYYTSERFHRIPGLGGRFSISPHRWVHFSPGNLLCDASGTDTLWTFEKTQYFVPYYNEVDGVKTSYDNAHVRHFFWSTESGSRDDSGYGLGERYYFSDDASPADTTDWGEVYNESNSTQGWFTLSAEEWRYLLRERGEASLRVREDVTIAGLSDNFLVLAPDDNTTAIKDSYDLVDWRTAERNGFVCLSPTGFRYEATGTGLPCIMRIGTNGFYWSRDAAASLGTLDRARYMEFGESPFSFSASASGDRSKAMAVRLVIE